MHHADSRPGLRAFPPSHPTPTPSPFPNPSSLHLSPLPLRCLPSLMLHLHLRTSPFNLKGKVPQKDQALKRITCSLNYLILNEDESLMGGLVTGMFFPCKAKIACSASSSAILSAWPSAVRCRDAGNNQHVSAETGLHWLSCRERNEQRPPSVPPQEILRKFEFFPIKCRIQRATEVFRAAVRGDPLSYTHHGHHGHHGQPPSKQRVKSKVRQLCHGGTVSRRHGVAVVKRSGVYS
jgi:hypothetical protein